MAVETDVTIRPATLEDQQAALALIEELFEPPGRPPPDYSRERARDGFRRYVERPEADVLLAIERAAIVGLASVWVDIPSIRFGLRCWLEDLVVTSSRRGRRIGARLLDAAEAWARERGCTHLELDSGNGRKDAHRFYLARGMTQDGLVFGRRLAGDA